MLNNFLEWTFVIYRRLLMDPVLAQFLTCSVFYTGHFSSIFVVKGWTKDGVYSCLHSRHNEEMGLNLERRSGDKRTLLQYKISAFQTHWNQLKNAFFFLKSLIWMKWKGQFLDRSNFCSIVIKGREDPILKEVPEDRNTLWVPML